MISKKKLEGLPVRDAHRAVMLHITRADATNGQKDAANCAAAKAACRLKGVKQARIFRTRSYLQPIGKMFWWRYMTPNALRTEAVSFDRGAKFEPGSYKLMPAPKSMELGAQFNKTGKGTAKTGTTVKRTTPHVLKGVRPRAPVGNVK